MKRIFVIFILGLSILSANEGENIYNTNCLVCHNSSTEEMKAPPMQKIVNKLKMVKNRDNFVSFVSDYIRSPSQEKGYCKAKAYKTFGVMPSMSHLTSEEVKVVAIWLYDTYESTGDTRYKNGKNCGKKGCCQNSRNK